MIELQYLQPLNKILYLLEFAVRVPGPISTNVQLNKIDWGGGEAFLFWIKYIPGLFQERSFFGATNLLWLPQFQ